MKRMKQLVALMLSLLMVISVSACSFKSADDIEDGEETEVVEDQEEDSDDNDREYYDVGELIETDEYSFIVNDIFYFDDLDASFVVVDITYTNNTDDQVKIGTQSAITCYLDNQKATQLLYPDYPTVINNNLLFCTSYDESVNAGRSRSGLLVFVYYRAWETFEIECYDTIVRADFDDITQNYIVPPTEETEAVETEAPTPTPEPTPEPSLPYGEVNFTGDPNEMHHFVIDNGTRVFHLDTCPNAHNPLLPESLYVDIDGTYAGMIEAGYYPCQPCFDTPVEG